MDSTAAALNERALACYREGRREEAVRCWKAALAHDPGLWEVRVYLASALKELGEFDAAGDQYSQALELQPGLAEAHYNLGNIRQAQGRLEEAVGCYQQALAIKPDFAFALYNLGNIQRDVGNLDAAIECYKRAIMAAPDHAPSFNNLGNALKHKGNLPQAIQCYEAALQSQPNYTEARYNLGNALYEAADFEAALPWFDSAGIRDAQARALYCLYRLQRFDEFRSRLQALCLQLPHNSPQVANLAAHYAINSGVDCDYRFCPRPFDMVYHEALPELAPGTALRQALLEIIAAGELDERVQGRLHHGVQSAGNLFQREEADVQELAELVREHFRRYRHRHAGVDCELIEAFPEQLEFESSWYIRMQQGGHLDAHIHEGGWVSGVLYLNVPEQRAAPEEGCLQLCLHGDDYPLQADESLFPSRVVPIRTGDIVLFPASLFHRTLPFAAQDERICVAFDLKPRAGVH